MNKKKKIIILITIICLIIIGSITTMVILNNNKNDKIKLQEEKKYYEQMHKTMYNYYKIMFQSIKVPEDKKNEKIKLSLGDLERKGFPTEDFINFKDGTKCDKALSYATRKVKDNKYVIDVYYKCGSTANYDFTKLQKTQEKTNKLKEEAKNE